MRSGVQQAEPAAGYQEIAHFVGPAKGKSTQIQAWQVKEVAEARNEAEGN